MLIITLFPWQYNRSFVRYHILDKSAKRRRYFCQVPQKDSCPTKRNIGSEKRGKDAGSRANVPVLRTFFCQVSIARCPVAHQEHRQRPKQQKYRQGKRRQQIKLFQRHQIGGQQQTHDAAENRQPRRTAHRCPQPAAAYHGLGARDSPRSSSASLSAIRSVRSGNSTFTRLLNFRFSSAGVILGSRTARIGVIRLRRSIRRA